MSESPALVSWTLSMPAQIFRQFMEFSEAIAILKYGILAPGQILVCAGRCAARLTTKELETLVAEKRLLEGDSSPVLTAMVPDVFSAEIGQICDELVKQTGVKVPRNELVVSVIPVAKRQASDQIIADLDWLDNILGKIS